MKNKLELITLWRVFTSDVVSRLSLKKKLVQCLLNILFLKPSTHIDENRELTMGVSEKQIRG